MTSKLVVLSGGLDSSTLLYHLRKAYPDDKLYALSFYYAQKHKRELAAAASIAYACHIDHRIVDLTTRDGQSSLDLFGQSDSSLISSNDVPEGHYAAENMKQTVVPNRNMVMISLAAANAISVGADSIYLGVHGGDHFIYPDCRQRFMFAVDATVRLGNMGFGNLPEVSDAEMLSMDPESWFVRTPFITWTKADIAVRAFELGVPIDKTWSCYKGDQVQCGRCGTCVERLEALDHAVHYWDQHGRHFWDDTEYEDKEYWRTVNA